MYFKRLLLHNELNCAMSKFFKTSPYYTIDSLQNFFYFQVLHPISIICRFVSLIVFTTYDTKCVVVERASISNCNQDVYVPKPEIWILVWMAMSVTSSIHFICIVVDNMDSEHLNFQRQKAKKLLTKGSFISLLLLLVLTTTYYVFQAVVAPSTIGMVLAIIWCFWPSAMVLVAIFLNYTPRVHWKPKQCCYAICCCPRFLPFLSKYSLFFFYWTALVMYFLDATVMWIATTLHAAHQVVPLLDEGFPDETTEYKVIVVVIIGFTLCFHSRVLSFFWQKLFHGDKDLFCEPCSKLLDDETGAENADAAVATPPLAIAEGQPETKSASLQTCQPPTFDPSSAKCKPSTSYDEATAHVHKSIVREQDSDSQVFSSVFEQGTEVSFQNCT